MSPLKATCRDCKTEIIGEDLPEVGDLMIAHHHQGREAGSWTNAACDIFFVEEVDSEGKSIENGESRWLEATMCVVCMPYTGRLVYDSREYRPRGKERG